MVRSNESILKDLEKQLQFIDKDIYDMMRQRERLKRDINLVKKMIENEFAK